MSGSEKVTKENLLDKLRLHPKEQTPAVCMIAIQEIEQLRGQRADLLAACVKAEKFIDAIMSFYGTRLEVANWHMNGDLEPLDNFIDSNSTGDELEAIRAAIAKAQEGRG